MSVMRLETTWTASARTRVGDVVEVALGGPSPALLVRGPEGAMAIDVELHTLRWLQAILGEAIAREMGR